MERKDEQVIRNRLDLGSKVGRPRPRTHKFQRTLHEPVQVSAHCYPPRLHFRNSWDGNCASMPPHRTIMNRCAQTQPQMTYVPSAKTFPVNLEFIKNLGKGGEGQVQEWASKRTGALVAVKLLKWKENNRPHEVDILSGLPQNNFIIRYLGFSDESSSTDECAIVLEHCAHGDIRNFYQTQELENKAVFSEAFMRTVFSQLANALAFIHEGTGRQNSCESPYWLPLIHRDIKLENILIKTLGSKGDYSSIVIELADFSLATYYNPGNTAKCIQGTTAYWAPELTWLDMVFTPASDIWAMGAVMHYLAHIFLPVEDIRTTKERLKEQGDLLRYPL